MELRALPRDPEARVPGGARLMVGDFDDPDSLDRAMGGVDHLFLLTGGEQIEQHDAAAIAAAVRADVTHVVKLSALGVGRGGMDPITRWHRAGEERSGTSRSASAIQLKAAARGDARS